MGDFVFLSYAVAGLRIRRGPDIGYGSEMVSRWIDCRRQLCVLSTLPGSSLCLSVCLSVRPSVRPSFRS